MLALLCLSIPLAVSQTNPSKTTVLMAGRLLDVRTGNYLAGQAVLIEEGKIKELGPTTQVQEHAPRDATVIGIVVRNDWHAK
jgi:imidazolonepropionase-like amidohydrolase